MEELDVGDEEEGDAAVDGVGLFGAFGGAEGDVGIVSVDGFADGFVEIVKVVALVEAFVVQRGVVPGVVDSQCPVISVGGAIRIK